MTDFLNYLGEIISDKTTYTEITDKTQIESPIAGNFYITLNSGSGGSTKDENRKTYKTIFFISSSSNIKTDAETISQIVDKTVNTVLNHTGNYKGVTEENYINFTFSETSNIITLEIVFDFKFIFN